MYCIGNIYQIVYNENTEIRYIGSTFTSIKKRFGCHKSGYKKYLTGVKTKSGSSLYKYFDEYGVDNFSILLIKSYLVCRDGKQDFKHIQVYEQLWIKKLKCFNINPCFSIKRLTDKFGYEKNKKERLEKCRIYGQKNKEKISIRNKIYRTNNNEAIKERKARVGVCVCGQTINLDHKARHERTLRHINKIKK